MESDVRFIFCNAKADDKPDDYYCTEMCRLEKDKKIPHVGPHIARAQPSGNEIGRWTTHGLVEWNRDYRGR